MKRFKKCFLFFLLSIFGIFAAFSQVVKKPDAFGYIEKEIPSIHLEMRYYGSHNFIGKPIHGYKRETAILTKVAIQKLKKVQQELVSFGLSLKIFDAYRPQRAVDHFVTWAKDEKDTLMKQEFYPDVAKKNLFKLDYIAAKSGHSRGSTVDLTIVSLKTGEELDMGSPYDFFGKTSWPFEQGITKEQRAHRMLLRTVMLSHGFKPYDFEWWHFTLNNESFPNTYFDFVVE